ncbi:hypothetical protein F2Q69_00004455 [Brassica cretica]|uniref:Acid phosphatase n=1 Tax=Brassica cretica TaxID=69181 RepID=A0A8S9P0G9_BRACR|nr:hypothetical protein F2Q69_00004455 [Brassica cretica]
MKMGRFEGFYLSGVLNSFLLFCNGGTTSRYVRRLEATADMPLDSDVFHVERSTAYQPWIWTVGNHELDFAPQTSTVMPATMNVHRLATYRDRLQAGSPVQPELQAFRLASDSPVQ